MNITLIIAACSLLLLIFISFIFYNYFNKLQAQNYQFFQDQLDRIMNYVIIFPLELKEMEDFYEFKANY